ncbi:MAG: dependent ligase [Nocardioides sp.]|jgi:bifunctional non-homologous end joining protein LigD|uniref:ATP-dependent DNA ligase n=1 Tax=Nocardioides sp. TaxID=35761 RepID=UPI002617E79F|nr:DNA ligase [Nocardioides sp.]MCW2832291.1 dependent ligase [Nocardioides sp.]
MRPMLASKGTHVPTGSEWSHEVKWDGVRILGDVVPGSDGRARLLTRNGNDASLAWPDVHTSPLGDRDVLVDGEIIGLNDAGLPDFGVLQERMHVRSATSAARLAQRIPATYMVFDLLRLDGHDLSGRPLSERQEMLAKLELDGSWQVPAAYDDGAMLFDATLQQGLEGIVSKRLASRYVFDARTPHWVKLAHRHRYSFVVAGWRPQEGTSDRLASVLVGEPTPDGLLYRGRVGSGIGGAACRLLSELVKPHEVAESPFADQVPAVDAKGTHWVEPRVVVDVDAHSRPPVTRLRQPSFVGVRSDIGPEDLL